MGWQWHYESIKKSGLYTTYYFIHELIAHQQFEKYRPFDESTAICFNDPKSPNALLTIQLSSDYNTDNTIEDDAESAENDALQVLLALEPRNGRG